MSEPKGDPVFEVKQSRDEETTRSLFGAPGESQHGHAEVNSETGETKYYRDTEGTEHIKDYQDVTGQVEESEP